MICNKKLQKNTIVPPLLPRQPHILLLGGTHEALYIAQYCDHQSYPMTYSLKGVTPSPRHPHGATRIGGFGGIQGLKYYCQHHHVTHIIDATHPFSYQMNTHAYHVSQTLNIAFISLVRPSWTPVKGALYFSSLQHIGHFISSLCQTRRHLVFFSALGTQGFTTLYHSFIVPTHCQFIVRSINSSFDQYPHVISIHGLPNSNKQEHYLFHHHQCDFIIMRDSGGAIGYEKIHVAQECSIPILMLTRTQLKKGLIYQDKEAICHIIDSWVSSYNNGNMV